jgi:hypothetical protein
MEFLKNLFSRKPEVADEKKPLKYHCIRFMTERGEQMGLLLTQEEFEVAVNRWVQTIDEMPISETAENEEGVP